MHLTDGARRLRDATTGETQAAIASRLGCDDHRVDILQAIDELLERGNR